MGTSSHFPGTFELDLNGTLWLPRGTEKKPCMSNSKLESAQFHKVIVYKIGIVANKLFNNIKYRKNHQILDPNRFWLLLGTGVKNANMKKYLSTFL